MLTCQCVRVVNPEGELVLLCQVPQAPAHLPPGSYNLLCQSDDVSLSGRRFRFEWTGTEWKRKNAIRQNSLSSSKNTSFDNWLNKSFGGIKEDRHSYSSSSSSIASDNSKKLRLTTELAVSQRDYEAGEYLTFTLCLKNCKFYSEMNTLSIKIVQKITTFENQTPVTMERVVAEEEKSAGGFCDGEEEICWDSQLQIPEDVIPSMSWKDDNFEAIQVSYSLQFQVEMADGQFGPDGEAPIVIRRGRSRESQKIRIDSTIFQS